MDEDESEDPKVGTATDYEYVTEAYGAVSCSAKVTKHVARVKMPNTGLTWNEEYLVSWISRVTPINKYYVSGQRSECRKFPICS